MPTPINISASRGASILGLSKWSTPTETWLQIMESREPGFCEKNNFLLPVFEDSAVLRWGKAFESAIIELAELKSETGFNIADRECFYEKGFLTCHIDGRYDGDNIGNYNILHEGKTTNAYYFRDNFGEPGTDRVPVEYQIQCQHQMICTGAEKVILSVLVFPKRVDEFEADGLEITGPDGHNYKIINDDLSINVYPLEWARPLSEMGYFHQYEIPANPLLQSLMISSYTEFWNNHVIGKTPPPPQSYDDIRAIIREPVGTIIATEEIERLQSEYKNIKSEISGTGSLAKRAEQIKVQLLDYMNKSDKVIDDDSGDRFILRDRAGKKIGQYSKNKNGVLGFR